MASQHTPLVTDVTDQYNSRTMRHSQRYRSALAHSQRPKPEREIRRDAASACIDLTGYREMNDDSSEELLVSPVSEDKVQVRSLSNCENEATVAVDKIKSLLECRQKKEQIVIGSTNRKRIGDAQSTESKKLSPKESSRPDSMPSPTKVDSREELWLPELSLPSDEDQSISVYEMTKARLHLARRNKSAQRLQPTEMELLTRKHEELVQKASENKQNSSALIEIIHIENDQVVSSPKSTVTSNKLDSPSNKSARRLTGNDLLSSMVYEFHKEDDKDKQADIIVIDNVLSRKAKSKYDAIKASRSGRLQFEKTHIHPLSSFVTTQHAAPRKNTQDSTLKSLNSIRDQVKILQQQKETEEPLGSTREIDPVSNKNLSKSENEDMDSLIVCGGSQSMKSSDSDDLAKQNESRANVIDIKPTTKDTVISSETSHDRGNEVVDANDQVNDKIMKAESVLNPSSQRLDSEKDPSNTESQVKNNADALLEPRPSSDGVNEHSTDCKGEAQVVNSIENSLPEEISKIIPHEPLSTGITASDLCIGFCMKKGDDSVSLIEQSRTNFETSGLEYIQLNNQSVEHDDSVDKWSASTDQPSRDYVTRTQDDTSMMNENYVERGEADQDSQPVYNPDLAISAEDSSSSYPSDVEIDDDANAVEDFQRDPTIVLHSKATDSIGTTTQIKNVKIPVVLPRISTMKKDADVSTSDNGSSVTDNSGTRVSLGDSDNTDSDLEEEAGLYDTCFARQLLDATCFWLEKDLPICIQPSLLKKVKRRNVGTRGKQYGRAPLMLRVPRNQNLPRTNMDSRRKGTEKIFIRSRRNSQKESLDKKDHKLRFARSRRNQNIFGSDGTTKSNPIKSKETILHEIKTRQMLNDETKGIDTVEASATRKNHLDTGRLFGEREVGFKSLGINEVKSADDCKNLISSNVEKVLKARSLSPTTVKNVTTGKLSFALSNSVSEVIVLDDPSEKAENNGENAAGEFHVQSRNKSRREGLAKLRRHHQDRHSSVGGLLEDSRLEEASGRDNEDQRFVALELAEKLRHRALTLKRRRQIRERRKELRCTDNELALSPIGNPEIRI